MRKPVFTTLFLLSASIAAADQVTYNIRMGTNPLVGHPAAPFYLAFEYAGGQGTGNANNLAILSDFQFGLSGGPSGSPLLFGSAFGDLTSEGVLTDAAPQSIFAQSFNPGDWLSFNLLLSTNSDPDGVSDGFVFSILDGSLTPIPSTQGGMLNPFLTVDLGVDGPVVQTFPGELDRSPAAGGPPIGMAAPVVDAPEPAGLALLGGALVLIGAARKSWLKRAP